MPSGDVLAVLQKLLLMPTAGTAGVAVWCCHSLADMCAKGSGLCFIVADIAGDTCHFPTLVCYGSRLQTECSSGVTGRRGGEGARGVARKLCFCSQQQVHSHTGCSWLLLLPPQLVVVLLLPGCCCCVFGTAVLSTCSSAGGGPGHNCFAYACLLLPTNRLRPAASMSSACVHRWVRTKDLEPVSGKAGRAHRNAPAR